jgi:hypothetical protein
MRPTFACPLALALLLAGAAGAYRYDVRAWSASWQGLADDFEDGVLPMGGPGEAPIYRPICGVTGGSESGGALVLAGPDPACPASPGAILATTGGTSLGESRATFRFAVPALGQNYGISLASETTSDTALLVLARNAVPPFFEDALVVALLADAGAALPAPVAFAVLSVEPPHDAVSAAAIELRLETASGVGGIVPTGSYRLCTMSPCEDETTTPFLALTPAPGAPLDGGALDPGTAHGPALVAFSLGAGDFAFEVEEWETHGSASDDFEGAAFGEVAPYAFACGTEADVEQAGGLLSLIGPVAPCDGNQLGFLAGLPGPLLARASFDFAVPAACEAYGLSAAAPDGSDFAFLSLVRSPDPLDPEGGGEALLVQLASEPEPGGPPFPVVASARISGDPLGDPALADVVSIELQLALAADLAGLVPTGRFRLCASSGCPDEFTPLEPGVPAPVPDALLCGLPAASYDPPADGVGALAWQGPVGAALVATRVPEAGSAAAALATLLALRARRARTGRQ